MYTKFILLLILISTFTRAQEIKKYNGKISIDSLKNLNAEFKINYSNIFNEKEIYFYLNKNAEIKSIIINNTSVDYISEDLKNFLPDLKKIRIINTFPKEFNLKIKYNYPLNTIEHPTFLYNPHWIELSLYTGWFPVNLNDKNYSYKLNFKNIEGYNIISSGNIKKNKSKTIFINNKNYNDIAVVISDKFQTFSTQSKQIQFYGIQLSNQQISEIQNTSENIFHYYESILEKNDSDNLIIAVNPFAHEMSYARTGFISLSLKNNFANNDKKLLAHEIGHLWWKNAPFGTFEEWLNESFAEFFALKWMQSKLTTDEFLEFLKKYETAGENSTKISQAKPNDDNWYSIAYFKGPYILYNLEQIIGHEKMQQFLNAAYREKVSKTSDLLTLLKKYTDESTIKKIEQEIF